MARLPRLVVPHQLHYVIQQGNAGQLIFREPEDYSTFLAWLRDAARQFSVAIHAYALLPDRLHLLATPADESGLSKMMQWVGRHYVPWFNRKYARSGTLWQGRYKTTVIDPDNYLLLYSGLIEYAPVHGGLAAHAGDYAWSSYRHHAGVKADPLIIDHELYWKLGNTPFDREIAYTRFLEQAISQSQLESFELAAAKGWAIGSAQFKKNLEKLTKRRVSPLPKGRPRKTVTSA